MKGNNNSFNSKFKLSFIKKKLFLILISNINIYKLCFFFIIMKYKYNSKFIYPTNDVIDVGPRPANAYQQFWQVDNSLVNSLKQLVLNDTIEDKEYGYSMISSSLSLALCCKFIN